MDARAFRQLIRRILNANDDILVLITGAPSERPEAEEFARAGDLRSDRCIAFAGETTLGDLPVLCALAAVMVTNDSGPAHFAAAGGLPTIVLFGPETPNLYQPLGNSKAIYAGLACSPCVSASNHQKSACDDNVCMRAISRRTAGSDNICSARHSSSDQAPTHTLSTRHDKQSGNIHTTGNMHTAGNTHMADNGHNNLRSARDLLRGLPLEDRPMNRMSWPPREARQLR